MRIGPRMAAIQQFVTTNPGCTKLAAAQSLMYHGRSSNRYGYAAVDRAIAAGIVRQVERPEHRGQFRLELP